MGLLKGDTGAGQHSEGLHQVQWRVTENDGKTALCLNTQQPALARLSEGHGCIPRIPFWREC